jgi:hypothetical protein
LWATACSTTALAQAGDFCQNSSKLGCLIPNVYGTTGLTLPNNFHRAHFLNDFQSNFTPLNSAIASQLTLLPIASPASGFTYTFNQAAGVFTRSAQSFGPILTERAETLGRGKIFAGVTYQRFGFDKIDGFDLQNFPAVFTHSDDPERPPQEFEKDFITTRNSIDLNVDQFTIFGSVGVTDWLDVSLAVPILNVDMKIDSEATIHRIAPPSPQFGQAHFFDASDPENSTRALFTNSGDSSGIGDILVRFKGTAFRGESFGIALAADLRLPTGDELDFLGSGAVGFKPFAAVSLNAGRVAPHFNVGYQWNGDSVLAGDVQTQTKGDVPDQFFYAIGADLRATRNLTFAFDVLGQRVLDAERVMPVTFVAPDPSNQQVPDQISLEEGSFNMADAAVGAKYNAFGRLLFTGNVIVRLDSGGLRDRLVPLFGVSYTFR